jgi:quercetin dioxygenase-like cupin family protein
LEIAPAADAKFERGKDDEFTGEVWLRRTVSAPDGTNVAIVHFAPGARTFWHRHPGGQFLYGMTGRGRVRTRGEPGRVLEAGDVLYVEPDRWHFHAGGDGSPMVHLAVNCGGRPEFDRAVTDEEYAEGF